MFIHSKFILFSLMFKNDFLYKHKFIQCLEGLSLEWAILKSRPLFLGVGMYQKLSNNYRKSIPLLIYHFAMLVSIHQKWILVSLSSSLIVYW